MLDEAADLVRGTGAEVAVVHTVPVSFGEHSVGLPETLRHGQEVLESARPRVAGRVPELPMHTTLARRFGPRTPR